jgi:hypothetical protein
MTSIPIPADIDRSIKLASLASWAEANGYRLTSHGGRLWLQSQFGKYNRPRPRGSAKAAE